MTEAQVLQCGEDLKTFYRGQMCKIKPNPLDFNIILEFEQIYTNLTLLRSEKGTRRTKMPLDYTDLLTTQINGEIPKRLLVEGEGGVGKTTFCSKIAWDWVTGSPEFQNFSWVLVIPLRNVVKGQTIGDIMLNYLSDSNAVSPRQIDNYILSQPTKVLIVLDGLDEYDGDLSTTASSDISQILRSEKFKECIVLVTTRPWRAEQIKSNEGLSRLYAFIAVEGFSADNVSKYIKRYFINDEKAGSELSRFIEVNDVIKENMSPFPIFVAMLCILWEHCDREKRETIRRLKTFSQLFEQMIMYLRDHYVSKVVKVLRKAHLDKEMESIKLCLQSIGSIAFSGLLNKKLVFNEEDFSSCKDAMETCCRIGVLSQENRNVSGWKRTLTASQSVITSVFFPHKLFQEYIASVYLASLYDTNREEYSRSMGEVLMSKNPQEFRYLLYFTAALGREVGLDIVKKIQQKDFPNVRQRTRNNDFLADITFEAYDKDTAKAVGQHIFADEKKLTFDKDKPAHTVSGYLFVMEQHGMETLVFRDRSCGPTVSRDLADVLFASNSLSRLEFYRTTLDDDFYQLMRTHLSTMAVNIYIFKQNTNDYNWFLSDEFMPLCYTQSTPLVNRCLYFSGKLHMFREAKKATKVLKIPWIKCKSTFEKTN
ncbi:baculoviral IAP repeat-containing protein 1f-like [Strongylocentrotus purpuratus]|uniref:NACHT domain-containing protein n=1 Tax=Strongylocentrotus purpuratus TaxID=7668 RepID=A0A7M7P1T2_STRPU|nr:baculoviral IAP repeat-containing protein 1f-like [Strongylocentrotus purpuratus]